MFPMTTSFRIGPWLVAAVCLVACAHEPSRVGRAGPTASATQRRGPSPAESATVSSMSAPSTMVAATPAASAPGERLPASAEAAAVLPPLPADGTCPAGYRLVGGRCEDLDECAQVATPCRTTLATCENRTGGYTCTCPPGYVGGGPSGMACSPRVISRGSATCVLPVDGGVSCFGLSPTRLGAASSERAPPQLPGFDDAVSVSGLHYGHRCVLRSNGRVACWGANELGQVGDGTTEFRDSPVELDDLRDVVVVDADDIGSCAIVRGGLLSDNKNSPPATTRTPHLTAA